MKFSFCLFFISLGLCIAFKANAQDLHFTQFEFTPVLMNPGQTGNFNGTYRISGLYRDQSVSPSGFTADFKTPYITIDVNFGFAFRKKDWTSLGVSLFDDRSGDINIGKGGFLASGAYHFALGGGDLALGAQFGSISFSTKNPEKAIFYDQLQTGSGSSQDLQKLQQGKGSYNDLSAGLVLTTPLSVKKHSLKMGFALNHLNKPTVSVLGSGGDKLGMLLNVHGSLQYHYNEKIDFIPTVYFRSLEKNKETIGQCMVSYLFNVEKKVRLNAGLGYRFGDAIQIMAGMDYGKIKAQIGYDQTIGDLKDAKDPAGFGALEIGISYTGAIIKKPNPKPKVFCPRF
ncbi:MAG: PorP/SprF family type IX secretion system membrane protein [Saprospiraceae bacterium]|nr:PorP/SprF family type IX secretion system membrane protein [Saprospiraceae bacterium]